MRHPNCGLDVINIGVDLVSIHTENKHDTIGIKCRISHNQKTELINHNLDGWFSHAGNHGKGLNPSKDKN